MQPMPLKTAPQQLQFDMSLTAGSLPTVLPMLLLLPTSPECKGKFISMVVHHVLHPASTAWLKATRPQLQLTRPRPFPFHCPIFAFDSLYGHQRKQGRSRWLLLHSQHQQPTHSADDEKGSVHCRKFMQDGGHGIGQTVRHAHTSVFCSVLFLRSSPGQHVRPESIWLLGNQRKTSLLEVPHALPVHLKSASIMQQP